MYTILYSIAETKKIYLRAIDYNGDNEDIGGWTITPYIYPINSQTAYKYGADAGTVELIDLGANGLFSYQPAADTFVTADSGKSFVLRFKCVHDSGTVTEWKPVSDMIALEVR